MNNLMRDKSLLEREQEIDDFDMSFVFEKIQNDNILSKSDFPKVQSEFKKFMKLILRENGPFAVVDKRIDEFWHSFILFTPQYIKFCEETMGFFVHHQPRTSFTPIPIIAIQNFVDAYIGRFNILDPFWLENLPVELISGIENECIPDIVDFKWSGWIGRKGV